MYAQYLSCDGKWNNIPSESAKQSLEVNLGWTTSQLQMRVGVGSGPGMLTSQNLSNSNSGIHHKIQTLLKQLLNKK